MIFTGTSFTYLPTRSYQRDGAGEGARVTVQAKGRGAGAAQASLRVPLQLPGAQLRADQINFGPHLIVGADREASGGGVTGTRESAKSECAEKGGGRRHRAGDGTVSPLASCGCHSSA